MGEVLNVIGPGNRTPDYLQLAADVSLGDDRMRLIVALGKIGGPDADAIILDALRDDDQLGFLQCGMEAVRKRRLLRARSRVVELLSHKNGEVRGWARQTMRVLDRAAIRTAKAAAKDSWGTGEGLCHGSE